MSYKVLYRKYRPDSFKKIIGQKSIVDNLQKSIMNNSFAHAFVFTGPRGTGKTSTAKVLAKTINCKDPINGEACGKCECCSDFNTSPDIIEIDAASNNGVDEIRELRNNITLTPTASNYKIYIIDEVHMLSPGAFNALLKTLEEPPAHAIFILATTEVYKVPITILSRCQRYDFKKIGKKNLVDHLKDVCNQENIEYEDKALEEIYSLSEGCLRDALSILDQTSKNKTKITVDDLLDEYNIISDNAIQTLLDSINEGNAEKIITILEEFENTGMNSQKLIKKIINHIEKVAIEIKLNREKKYSFQLINTLIRSLNECYIDARINENVFTMIKLSFIELIKPEDTRTAPTKNVKTESPKTTKKLTKDKMSLIDIRINNCFVEVNRESLSVISKLWDELDIDKIASININDYRPVASSDKYAIFSSEEESLAHLFNIKCADVEKMLKKQKLPLKVVAVTNERWQTEKEKYKTSLKNNEKYEYIEEPKPDEDGAAAKGQINDLFTDKIVEIS